MLLGPRRQLTLEEAAYIAGFVDGEGCVSYEKYKTKDGIYFRPTVIIGNNNKEVLEWICLAVGYGLVRPTKKRPRCKQQYVVRWACDQAKHLLIQIYPFLKVKGARAKLILDILEETSNPQGAHLPKEFHAGRLRVHSLVKTLNQRGDSSAVN